MLYRAQMDILNDVIVCIAAVKQSLNLRVTVPHRCRSKVICDARVHALIITYIHRQLFRNTIDYTLLSKKQEPLECPRQLSVTAQAL